MCKKFILGSCQETIENRFNLSPNSKLEWEPLCVFSPGDETLIISQQNPKEITISRYVMTPEWAKQPMNLINARLQHSESGRGEAFYRNGKEIQSPEALGA